MQRTAILLGAAAALGFALPGSGETQVLSQTGDGAPDGNGAFLLFDVPFINDAGQVVFEGFLSGTSGGGTDNGGLFLSGPGQPLQQLVREGEAPPEGDGVFGGFGVQGLNSAGQAVFQGTISGSSLGLSNNSGMYSVGPGAGVGLIAREGEAVPTPPGTYSGFGPVSLNDAGQGAFLSILFGAGTDDYRLYRLNADGSVSEEVREGQTVPGGNGTFASFDDVTINAAGDIVYLATLAGTSGGGLDNSGVYRDNAVGGRDTVVREGESAPGGNGTYSGFNGPVQNNAGQVAFFATLTGTSGGTSDNTGIFRTGAGGTVAQIAREGFAVPGGDGVFSSLITPSMNDSGQVLFRATLIGTSRGAANDSAVYVSNAGSFLTEVVREGDVAPDGNGVLSGFVSETLLPTGQVAYHGQLTGTPGGSADDQAVYLTDGTETIRVVREGDAMAGSTVSSFTLAPGHYVNAFGQVAYDAVLTNGNSAIGLFTPDIHWRANFSSSWDTAARWTVGLLPGDPHDVFIDPDVSLTVTGPGGEVTVSGLTIGGNNGVATLQLNGGTITTRPGGHVSIEATGILTGDGVIGGIGGVLNNGTVQADNLTIDGNLTNAGLITGDGRINASISNESAGGELRVAEGDRLRIIGASASITNFGRIDNLGGELEVSGAITNRTSLGLIVGDNATFRFSGGLTNQSGTAVSSGTNRFFGDITNTATGTVVVSGGAHATFYDDVTNNGSIVVAAAGTATSTAVFFGEVSGAGSITGGGNVFLHGDLRPGNSPAAVTHDAHLFFMPTATTQIELGGTNPGTDHDQINNLKSTALGGTLEVMLINGFDPDAGDTFDIFNFASQSGTFSDILLPTLDTGLGWHLGALYTDGELHVELLGDLNLDGQVGVEDLDLLLARWGDSALAFDYAAGDASGDGLVGEADLQLVLDHWGNSASGGGNVPEPGTAVLLVFSGFLLRRRRHRV